MGDCSKSSCEGCKEKCSERKDSLQELSHPLSNIKHVLSIVSGKGGVGKSLVTASLAVALRKKGYQVGILDADITGPSIPKIFGIKEKAMGSNQGIYPCESETGIKIISVNLLLQDEDTPVIWRGPVIAGIVKQFWTDVIWGDLDFLLIDMPPGTGDVPLTVFQTIPLSGAVIVTTPQDLVSMIVKKSYHMAEKMQIPVLGMIENMSYVVCPDCGKQIFPFGKSKIEEITKELNISLLAKLPIFSDTASLLDQGLAEKINLELIIPAVDEMIEKLNRA